MNIVMSWTLGANMSTMPGISNIKKARYKIGLSNVLLAYLTIDGGAYLLQFYASVFHSIDPC